MKDTKRCIETFSFFDHTGISAHLEKMAQKGWMIQKITNYGWVYRRITPANLHFTVSYAPNASEFDAEPSERLKLFRDFCMHTGWKLACSSAQLQIFYNSQENSTPIETEPALELNAICASMKKSFIPAYIALLIIALLGDAMTVSNLLGDPIDFFASTTKHLTGIAFMLLTVSCLEELICCFLWYTRARRAAEYGEFLKTPNTARFQKGILILIGICAVYWCISFILCGSRLQRWTGVLICFYIPVLYALVNAVKNFLKQNKVRRNTARTLTFLSSFLLSFSLLGLITYAMLTAADRGLLDENGEKSAAARILHQSELPLTLEDLTETTYKDYIREQSSSTSLFLDEFVMKQHPRYDAANYAEIPRLEYRLIAVKVPALYDMCKQRLLYEQEILRSPLQREYREEAAGPWGANQAYRLYEPIYGAVNRYLLCYDDMLAEIEFDWEPTDEQKAISSKKLLKTR